MQTRQALMILAPAIALVVIGYALFDRAKDNAPTSAKAVEVPVDHAPELLAHAAPPAVSDRLHNPGSILSKQEWERTTTLEYTRLSAQEYDAQMAKGHEAFTTENGKELLDEAYRTTFGEEEGAFLRRIPSMPWAEAHAALEARSKVTGQDYGALAMTLGLSTGDISAAEIEALVNRGTTLPLTAPVQLAQQGGVEALEQLVAMGLIGDVNAQNPWDGKNALGALVHRGLAYRGRDAEVRTADAIKRLIALGAAVKPQHGGFDPLDYALAATRFTARNKLVAAKVLLESGAPIEQSHREALAAMPPGEMRDQFTQLFTPYL